MVRDPENLRNLVAGSFGLEPEPEARRQSSYTNERLYSSYDPLKSRIAPAVEVPDARADFLHHVLVVGHEQDRAFELLQRHVQRVDRLEVEVVRRLVEHEHVRLLAA